MNNLPPEACESTARGNRAKLNLFDDPYFVEMEEQYTEEGILSFPDVTIRFFEGEESPCIFVIEDAYYYPIPRRKDYVCLPFKPNDYYRVRNVVTIYESDGSVTIEVFVNWVDICSLDL